MFWFGRGEFCEMALDLVYGVGVEFWCILHHIFTPARWEGSPALLWPRTEQNRPKLKLQFVLGAQLPLSFPVHQLQWNTIERQLATRPPRPARSPLPPELLFVPPDSPSATPARSPGYQTWLRNELLTCNHSNLSFCGLD